MKIRLGYVSNSSSASFVVYNWFDLPLKKRLFIRNYNNNAMNVWLDNNIPFERTDWNEYKEPYFDDGLVWKMSRANEKLTDSKQEAIIDKYGKFAFGYLFDSCVYRFEENKKRNTCTISTSMTNFDMEKWLKYNNVDFDELAGW